MQQRIIKTNFFARILNLSILLLERPAQQQTGEISVPGKSHSNFQVTIYNNKDLLIQTID